MATLTKRTDFPVGVSPSNVVLGDVNGDGSLDIVTTNSVDSSDVSVLLGNGKGTFSVAVNYPAPPLGYIYFSPMLSDINGDGKIDVLLDSTYLPGDGQGSFGSPSPYPDNASPFITGDFNNDSKLDFVMNGLRIYLGDGNGNFTPIPSDYERLVSTVVAADFNNDGNSDLAYIQGRNVRNGYIALGDGTGHFDFDNPIVLDPSFELVGGEPPLLVGDVNHDGNQDVITSNLNHPGGRSHTHYELAVSLGDGTGHFNLPLFFASSHFRASLKLADLNRDGNLDIVAADTELNSASVLWGYGDGRFSSEMFFAAGDSPISVAVGDMDSDGVPDIVTVSAHTLYDSSNPLSGTVSILGELRPDVEQKYFSTQQLETSNFPGTVKVGDVNGDGRLDIVAIDSESSFQSIESFWGDGKGNFSSKSLFTFPTTTAVLAVGDFNNDKRLDLLTYDPNANQASISVQLGDGTGGFSSQLPLPFAAADINIKSLVTADLNKDGKLDIIAGTNTTHSISVFFGQGNGNFASPKNSQLSSPVHTIATEDMNRDGKLDLIAVTEQGLSVLLAKGGGNFNLPIDTSLNFFPDPFAIQFAIGDINNDKKVDVLVSDGNNLAILRGDGTGNLSAPSILSISPLNIEQLTLSDFNGDGKLDVGVLANSAISVLWGDGTGSFAYNRSAQFNAGVSDNTGFNTRNTLTTADINRDGQPDLLTANLYLQTISVLLNTAVNGTQTADLLSGNARDNGINGGGGNDTLYGGVGDDILDGGSGSDDLYGGEGYDFLYGERGKDNMWGQGGNDQMWGDAGSDNLYGGNGNDNLHGGDGIDELQGNQDSDRLWGEKGADVLSGGAGDDLLYGGPGNDDLYGNTGADQFIFTSGGVFTSVDFGVDPINDFSHTQGDKIVLSKSSFTSLTSIVGSEGLNTSDFATIDAPTNGIAGNLAARIIYNQHTGDLLYNQDGVTDGLGTGGHFATLTNDLILNPFDFWVTV